MKIVAINASPRRKWNTATLVGEAAEGAKSEGAEIVTFNLYDLGVYSGCVSCFGCKIGNNKGKCVHKDGLSKVLDEIRTADGLIMGSPNYLGDVTAAFRALYERLVFQYITYSSDPRSYNERHIPVLMIMTSNISEERYPEVGYDVVLEKYKQTLSAHIGPTDIMISGDTLQVNDYSKYDWGYFDPEKKKIRHETEFPAERKKVFELGAEMVRRLSK